MRKYWAFYKLGLQNTLTYRGPMVIWLLGNIISLFMMVALWLSADASGPIGSYTKNELITYYIVSLALQWLIGWHPFNWIKDDIKSGDIVGSALIKPASFYWRGFAFEAAWHSISVFVGLASACVFYLIFKQNFIFLQNLSDLPFIICALVLSVFVVYSTSLCLGLIAFWFTQVDALGDIFWAALGVFGGFIVPLTFFPPNLAGLVKILPFRYMFSFPLEIYFHKISSSEIIFGLVVSLAWALIFCALYKVLWRKGTRAYSAWGQ